MGTKITDLYVETNGLCFLCLETIHPSPKSTILEQKLVNESQLFPAQSIQHLSRYLGIETSGLFVERGPAPSYLLAKVQRSKLKADLCGECAITNNKIGELCGQLEKIRMEVASCLTVILHKLDKTGNFSNKRNEDQPMTQVGKLLNEAKMGMADALREQTKQKCIERLSKNNPPRVKLRNLTKQDIQKTTRKCSNNASNNTRNNFLGASVGADVSSSEIEIGEIKRESGMTGDAHFDDDGDYLSTDGENMEVGSGDEHPKSKTSSWEHTRSNNPCESDEEDERTSNVHHGSSDVALALKFPEWSCRNLTTGMFPCSRCSKEFTQLITLQRHFQSDHLHLRFKCDKCNKEFAQEGSYRRHYHAAHAGVKFRCSRCDKEFAFKTNLIRHERDVHSDREYSCEFCFKSFKGLDGGRLHLKFKRCKASNI